MVAPAVNPNFLEQLSLMILLCKRFVGNELGLQPKSGVRRVIWAREGGHARTAISHDFWQLDVSVV
jgi:hypothetical protein